MDTYGSEEEQLQALKRWWDEHGLSTVLVIVVALAGAFGFRTWQTQNEAKIESSSVAYHNMLEVLSEVDANPDDIKIATALHAADALKSDFSGSGYSFFAAFFNAKQAVADKDYEKAETELRWVLEQKPDSLIRHLTNLRLAKVLFAAERDEEALAIVSAANDDDLLSFAPLYAEFKGDILLHGEKYQAALEAYEQAQNSALQLEEAESPMLSPKIQHAKSFL